MTPPKADGRTARRERGRDAVIAACLRLLDGTELPTADELTAEAGVSTSSLFRYFDGLDDVYQQAADRFYAEHVDLFEAKPSLDSGLDQRIVEYVDVRLATLALMERFVPVARTQTAKRPDLRPLFDRFRWQISAQFERYFRARAPGVDTRRARRSRRDARRCDVDRRRGDDGRGLQPFALPRSNVHGPRSCRRRCRPTERPGASA